LVSKNYDVLGDAVAAKKAKLWLYVGIGIFLVSLILSFVAPPARDTEIDWFEWLPFAASVVFFIVWYTVSAQCQEKLVRERFGKDYARKSWLVPIILAVACLIGVMFLDALVAGMKRRIGRSSANSVQPTGGSTVDPARKASLARTIFNEARQWDMAIDQWALEKGKRDGDRVNVKEVAAYLVNKLNVVDRLGNPYVFTTVGSSQLQVSPKTKSALADVDIDWGKF